VATFLSKPYNFDPYKNNLTTFLHIKKNDSIEKIKKQKKTKLNKYNKMIKV
jgi:hypothetical protein